MIDLDTRPKLYRKHTPVFTANLDAYESGRYRVISNEGSTRSSKTYSEIQLAAWVSLNPKIYGIKEFSVVSPSLPHLKKGARKDFLDIANEWNFFNEDDFNRTDNIYTFPGGSYIEFFGAEDAGKVRGPGRDILIVNEANLIPEETYIQLALRTREVIFLDYNPADEYNYVYKITDKPGNKKIHSTYLNNKGNLSKAQIEEIESLKDADENLWKVYGLGLRGTSSETIYTHWKQANMPGKGEVWYGQDFGYNVQSALIKVELYEGAIYADEVLYETKLTTTDLIEQYKILGIDRHKEIFCDAAEPKTIEELRRAGFNAKPADKDVTEGIRKVKAMPLYITPKSVNLIKELRSYKWRTDKDGKVLDEPVKFMDHASDALRYAVFTKLITPKRFIGVIRGNLTRSE
jgi:phage terminase large subunit